MEKLLKTNQDLSKTENSAIKREAISVKGVVVGSRQGGGWLAGGGGGLLKFVREWISWSAQDWSKQVVTEKNATTATYTTLTELFYWS